jgi:hypothetical protein
MSGKVLLKYSGSRDRVRERRRGRWFTQKRKAGLTIGRQPNPNNRNKDGGDNPDNPETGGMPPEKVEDGNPMAAYCLNLPTNLNY